MAPPPAQFSATLSSADADHPLAITSVGGTGQLLVSTRAQLATRRGIAREDWAVPGAYVLVGPADGPQATKDTVRARPGHSGDLLTRIDQHLASKEMDWFERAILISDLKGRLTTAHAEFLEGELHGLCDASPQVQRVGRKDKNRSLQNHVEDELRRDYLPIIEGALQVMGVLVGTDFATADKARELLGKRKRP